MTCKQGKDPNKTLEREAEITKMFKTPVKDTKRAIINMFRDVKEDVNMMRKKMEISVKFHFTNGMEYLCSGISVEIEYLCSGIILFEERV